MKNLMMLSVLFGLLAITSVGCGDGEPTVIEPAATDDSGITQTQQQEYEEFMRKGGSSQQTAPR